MSLFDICLFHPDISNKNENTKAICLDYLKKYDFLYYSQVHSQLDRFFLIIGFGYYHLTRFYWISFLNFLHKPFQNLYSNNIILLFHPNDLSIRHRITHSLNIINFQFDMPE